MAEGPPTMIEAKRVRVANDAEDIVIEITDETGRTQLFFLSAVAAAQAAGQIGRMAAPFLKEASAEQRYAEANTAVWEAIQRCPGIVTLPEFDPPFMLYPAPDRPSIQGQIQFPGATKPTALRLALTDEGAMQLLGLLDAYRENKGLPKPAGQPLARQ